MIDALDAMRAGIVELDAKAIRKAASKAKAVVQTLTPRRASSTCLRPASQRLSSTVSRTSASCA